MPGCVAGSAFIYCLSSNLEIQKFPPFIPKMHSQTRNSSKGLVVPQWLNLHLRRLIHLSFEVTRVPSPSLKTWKPQGLQGNVYFPQMLKKIHRKMRPGLVWCWGKGRMRIRTADPEELLCSRHCWHQARALLLCRQISTAWWPFCPKGFCFLSESIDLPEMNSFHFSTSEKVFISVLFSKYVFTHYRWTGFFFQYFESVVSLFSCFSVCNDKVIIVHNAFFLFLWFCHCFLSSLNRFAWGAVFFPFLVFGIYLVFWTCGL